LIIGIYLSHMVLWVLYKIFNSKLAVYSSITVVLFKKMEFSNCLEMWNCWTVIDFHCFIPYNK